MEWQFSPYVILLFIAGVTSFLWVLFGVKAIRERGREPYLIAFVALSLTATIWSIGYAIQVALTTLDAKLLAYYALHVGSVMVPSAWFIFALAYTDRSAWLTPVRIAAIVAIPFALLAALPTNPNSIALIGATLETRGTLTVLVTENGPLYLLHLAYSYVIIVLGAWFMLEYAARATTPIRRQSALLVVGVLVPLGLNVSNVLSIPVVGTTAVNLTPVSLAFSTVLFGIAAVRYRMLDLTPIASRVVLTQMDDGVILLDDRERIVEVNPAAERLLGDRETVIGSDISSQFEQFVELIDGDRTLVTFHDSDGTERRLRITRSSLTNNGELYGWVLLTVDVTVLERQRYELERKNERLDAFARVVSHDLRNYLGVIDGYAGLAEETGDAQHFDEIHDATDQMNTFLVDLLLLSQQGETVNEFHPVSLKSLAENVENRISDNSLTLHVETDAVVLADKARLRQVFDNLLRNAINHSDGEVTVTITKLPDGFAIEDSGPGIDPNVRDSIFDIGVSTRASGSGFGLAITHDIIDAHGWAISVGDSDVGGARFEITGVTFVPDDA